ncbi:hypothetical protein GCM10023185_34010 [Hymenobacter saemangeumensis]|uniref:Peptidase S74 domain-containing protein n=1 Tax=Hymenobacter saemangeumensis TaxID=1084522 RepID=A0ABP8IP49_9BACT
MGTSSPSAKAALDVQSPGGNTGLLIPRLSQAQRQAIASPPQGLMVYQTDGTPSGGPQTGFWYYAGSPAAWVFLNPAGGSADNLGNHTATQNLNLGTNQLVGSGGSSGLRISAAGSVGIGTATVADRLHVDGGHARLGLAQWSSAANDRLLKFGDGDYVTIGESGRDDVLQLRGQDFVFMPSSGGYDGRVGIGTALPSQQLHVVGQIFSSAGGFRFPDNTVQTTAATGFSLPYSGTAVNNIGPVFAVTNTGSSDGLQATSQGNVAVRAVIAGSSGIGVRGSAPAGQGVVGSLDGGSGQGVVGIKRTTGQSIPAPLDAGVAGVSYAGAAVYGRSTTGIALHAEKKSTDTGAMGVFVNSNADNDSIAVRISTVGDQPALQAIHNASTAHPAIRGISTAVFSNAVGVEGTVSSIAQSTNSAGVRGINNGSSSFGAGVYGSHAATGLGVRGVSNGGTGVQGDGGAGTGVRGISTTGVGVEGSANGTNSQGVSGSAAGANSRGVNGVASGSSSRGVVGTASGSNSYGLLGTSTGNYSRGVQGVGDGTGVWGQSNTGTGLFGRALNGVGVWGQGKIAGKFESTSNTPYGNAVFIHNEGIGRALYALSDGTAGYFETAGYNAPTINLHQDGPMGSSSINFSNGNFNSLATIEAFTGALNSNYFPIVEFRVGGVEVMTLFSGLGYLTDDWKTTGNHQVMGNLSKGGGSFKIDHPLDPENKYLYHSFVESPDMMNVYNGNITLDARGEATVQLPDWFETLNRDFRYQLTPIGAAFTPYVLAKVSGNQFRIAGQPGAEVSWQVTGIRQDKYANAHRIPVEEAKQPAERGYYLHPDAFGLPASRALGSRRLPAAPAFPARK